MDITSGATQITMAPQTTGGRAIASPETRTRRGGASHDRNGFAVEEAARLFCDSHSIPATARSYRTALTRLTDFCHAREVTACTELTPSLLAEYQSTLGDLAPSTREGVAKQWSCRYRAVGSGLKLGNPKSDRLEGGLLEALPSCPGPTPGRPWRQRCTGRCQ